MPAKAGSNKKSRPATRKAKKEQLSIKAWAATRRMKTMLPVLTKYARAVTRDNSVTVEVTQGTTSTDGKRIYIRPPIQLGENNKHKPGDCGKRGTNRRYACKACDDDEMVMGLLYHELAHICFGSYVETTDVGKRPILKLMREWHPVGVCDHFSDLFESAGEADTYIATATLFDERFAFLLNALEDARVNARMFEGRPGTRAMMDATVHDTFVDGVQVDDEGERRYWRDAPIDMQVAIGASLAASGYFAYVELLHEDAIEILGDPDLDDRISRIADTVDAHHLVAQTALIWLRLQELGVLIKDKCQPQPDPEDEPEDKAEDEPDDGDGEPDPNAESGSGGDSDSEQDGEAGDGSGSSAGGGVPGSSGGDAGQDQQPSESEPEAGDRDPEGGDGSQPERDNEGDDDGQPEDGDRGDADTEGHGDGQDRDQEPGDTGSGKVGEDEAGGSKSGGDEEEAPGEGEDEEGDGEDGESADEPEPADHTPASIEQIRRALRAGSLHKLLPNATDKLAVGEDILHHGGPDGDDGDAPSMTPAEKIMAAVYGDEDEEDEEAWGAAIETALSQSAWFDGPSENVSGVHLLTFPDTGGVIDWKRGKNYSDYLPEPSITGPIVTEGRIKFSPNKRNGYERHQKSGRIDGKAMAKQIPFGGEKIFKRKQTIKARSYHVVITMDVSGSTDSLLYDEAQLGKPGYKPKMVIDLMIRSVAAQAEALHRLGISFEVYAHSAGNYVNREEYYALTVDSGWKVWMYQVKEAGRPWDDAARERLACLEPSSGNLDGHTLEFVRKRAQLQAKKFTDVAICYYTDGAMPAANSREEGEILRRETALCRRLNIPLLAVGAGTDSPKEWGFDTVVISDDNDLPKVMTQLGKLLGV